MVDFKVLICSLIFTGSISSHAAVDCKKLKVSDFERKTADIINQLAKVEVINKSALTFSATGKRQKISPKCLNQDSYYDDGGSRCVFKCSIENEESVYLTLYENSRGQISLLDLKWEVNH